MALVVDTNSYIDATEADAYFADRLNSSEWDAALAHDKDKALIQATQVIDFKNYLGSKTSSAQALKFPRSGLTDDGYAVDSATVPQKVKDATCELAIYLLQSDYTEPDDLSEFDSVKIGPLEIQTKNGGRAANGGKQMPPFVKSLLRFAIAPSNRLYLG